MKQVFMMQSKSLVKPRGEWRSGQEDWLQFEDMIKAHLEDLDCSVNNDIVYLGDHDVLMEAADIVFYAHKRKKDVPADFFHKQMHLKKLFTLDQLGWGIDHSEMQSKPEFEKVDLEDAISFCQSRRQQFLSKGDSKFVQPPRNNNIKFPDSFFFFPLQRPRDETIKNHSPLPEVDIMKIVARWGETQKQHIVFKLHPNNIRDPEIIETVNALVQKYTYVHLLEGNVHDFIDRSKGVIVINSGVGFESLIHGKPVITFGGSDYQWATLRVDENSLDKAISYAENYSEDQKHLAWQFIYYYFFEHAYSIEPEYIESSNQRLYNYLSKRIKLSRHSESLVLEKIEI